MRTYPLKPIPTTQLTYKLTDFSKHTFSAQNLLTDKSITGANVIKRPLAKIPKDLYVQKIYNTPNRKFVYCSDQKIYEIKDNSLSLLTLATYKKPPEVFELILKGSKGVAVVQNGRGVIVGNTHAQATFPNGKGYTLYNGVLFCFNEDRIIFGGEYDHSGYTITLSTAGFIGVKGVGNILKLIPTTNGLLVVCERGFALLQSPSRFF